MRPSIAVITALTALTALGLTGCSDDDGGGNPDVLWLALDGTETQVRLVASEPTPF